MDTISPTSVSHYPLFGSKHTNKGLLVDLIEVHEDSDPIEPDVLVGDSEICIAQSELETRETAVKRLICDDHYSKNGITWISRDHNHALRPPHLPSTNKPLSKLGPTSATMNQGHVLSPFPESIDWEKARNISLLCRMQSLHQRLVERRKQTTHHAKSSFLSRLTKTMAWWHARKRGSYGTRYWRSIQTLPAVKSGFVSSYERSSNQPAMLKTRNSHGMVVEYHSSNLQTTMTKDIRDGTRHHCPKQNGREGPCNERCPPGFPCPITDKQTLARTLDHSMLITS